MPGPHAKFHQNCCTSLGEKCAQDTDGHSFIIISSVASSMKKSSIERAQACSKMKLRARALENST